MCNYEEEGSDLKVIFEGLKKCKVEKPRNYRDIIPITKVEVIPYLQDYEDMKQVGVKNGKMNFIYWKSLTFLPLKQNIMEYFKENNLINNNEYEIADNNEFINTIVRYIPISTENYINFMSCTTVEEALQLLNDCISNNELRCLNCHVHGIETPFCSSKQVFTMDDNGVSTNHVNPGGYTFTVTTVLTAINVFVSTPPSAEFSWFEGYTWEILHCSVCGNHIGWRFKAIDQDLNPKQFYGLRSDIYYKIK